VRIAWLAAVRGAIAAGFGAACCFVPDTGLILLERLVAAALLCDAGFAIATAARKGPGFAEAASETVAALLIVGAPEVQLFQLSFAAAAMAVLAGLARGAAWRRNRPRALALAAVPVVWGILTPARPLVGVADWAAWFGLYSMLNGALLLALGFDAMPRDAAAGCLTRPARGVSLSRRSRGRAR